MRFGPSVFVTQEPNARNCRYPREAHNFRKYGLEAAWRLGRWDMVKEYLAGAQQSNDFGGRVPFDHHLSQILISMKELDQAPAQACVLYP